MACLFCICNYELNDVLAAKLFKKKRNVTSIENYAFYVGFRKLF